MDSTNSVESANRSISADEFVTLLVRSERRVRAFVSTLHPHSHDVDEIVQDSSLVAWKKFGTFQYTRSQPDEEFVRWLCTIARFELTNFRRKRDHEKTVFDEALLGKLVDQYFQESTRLEERHEALMDCVNRLRPRDQEIVKRRYQAGVSVRELASYADRKVDTIYKTLTRIRGSLLLCIERSLKDESAR